MKSFLLIIFLSTTCTSQVLTPKAETLQEKNLKQFHSIETFAFKKWNSNDLKRIKEINDQVEAYFEVRELVLDNVKLHQECMKAVKMHSERSKRVNLFHNPTIDWKKVLFELQSWINHKGVY